MTKKIRDSSVFQKLQGDIERKQYDVEKMAQLSPLLVHFTSDEEAIEIEATVKNYMVRYENLGSRAAECGVLLQQVIQKFLQTSHI